MKANLFKVALGVMLSTPLFSSCSENIDESDLYTFTGQTIRDYLEANDSLFHQFNVILQRSGYDRTLATYGQYTCFAPLNEGVDRYIDSLYNDTTKMKVPHNGLTENSVNGVSDEMCKEIATYHLSALEYTYLENLNNAAGKEISTMMNTPFISKVCDDGIVRLNDVAKILEYDKEKTNGYVHVISDVIPRSSRRVCEVLEQRQEFKIFYEGLEKTGLIDSLYADKKLNADGSVRKYQIDGTGSSGAAETYYVPEECKIKYTIFAESDKVFAENGITDFASLKAKCVEWYADAARWYQYPGRASNPISTGDDYEYTYNVVNMFYRYHILKAGMPVQKLVFERDLSNNVWNYSFGGEPYDYYETMLPHTLMKIWQPYSQPTGNANDIWINRYRAHNTLTDEVGTFGTDETHQIIRPGCKVIRTESNIQSYNGYIHSIDRPLVYDEVVPNGVLNERLRFECGTMFYELINNNLRLTPAEEIGAMNQNGNNGSQTRIPVDYFDNMVSYNKNTKMYWCTTQIRRNLNCDKFLGYVGNDYVVRLPPVPTGEYEIRYIYPPGPNVALRQYSLGTSPDPADMAPLGGPVDGRYPNVGEEADRITSGFLLISEYDDYGVASDLAMRQKGFMRAPASFARGGDNAIKERVSHPSELIVNINYCCRYNEGYAAMMVRKILGTVHMEQDQSYWLRMKDLLQGYDNLGVSIDFIEVVPLHIVNSQDFTEDWY